MSTPPTLQPGLWYDITAQDVNPECRNYEGTFEVNPCYSNGGTVRIVCGVCGQDMVIVGAVLLDPQPEMS